MFREAFFALRGEPVFEPVQTAAGLVHVHVLTAGEKDALDFAAAKTPGVDFRARLVVAACRLPDGALAFGPADVPALSSMPYPLLEPVVEAAIRINKMTDRDAEDLRKN